MLYTKSLSIFIVCTIGRRTRPLAPACNVLLIRDDLSTIWCELTSSIRTRPLNDVDKELNIVPPSKLKQGASTSNNNQDSNESAVSSEGQEQEEKELLLCFRPIREGDTVGEELCFHAEKGTEKGTGSDNAADYGTSDGGPTNASSEDPKVSASTNNSASSSEVVNLKMPAYETQAPVASPSMHYPRIKNRPPKKRKFENPEEIDMMGAKRHHGVEDSQVEEPDEKSAVESMMELAKNPLY